MSTDRPMSTDRSMSTARPTMVEATDKADDTGAPGDGQTRDPLGGPEGTDDLYELDTPDGLDGLNFLDELHSDESSSTALFAGDDGRLDLAQRQALVAVLKKRFITAVTDPKVWRTVTADPQILRSRLHDLFMDLHIDTEREVAFKRQVTPEGGGTFPTLLYDTPWGREETIVLVHLRGRLRNEQAAGNTRVFVEREDIFEAVEAHRPSTATDHAADRKRVIRAIETLTKTGLLIGASTSDRFEISAAIEVILPLEKLHELLTWMREESSAPANPSDDVATTNGSRPATGGFVRSDAGPNGRGHHHSTHDCAAPSVDHLDLDGHQVEDSWKDQS